MIDIIFNDIDGCLVPENYDPMGTLRDHGPSERYFEYYRQYAGPQIVLCTGRGWTNTRGILKRADLFPCQRTVWPDTPVLCEHGVDIVLDPVTEKRISLIDELDDLAYLKPAARQIRQTADWLESILDSLRDAVAQRLSRPVTPLILIKKEFSLAVRMPFFEETGQQVDPPFFFRFMRETVDGRLGDLIEDEQVWLTLSSTAVDIVPPVSKGDGVRYVLERYGLSPDRALYIGDSVPDISGMEAVTWATCPANAVPEVRSYVSSLNGRGYQSPLTFADAELEILEKVQAGQMWG